MIKKILIANRGEIACRVIKTAKKMGIKTVAVYSDADKNALHVKMADEAYNVGPSPSNQSYIVVENIMKAIKDSGADAVHPGYGFLSENSKFAEALEAAGIAFIGPPVNAIEAMGDKITSKKLAAEAGVNTVPGFMGIIADADEAVKISSEIGYPVMLKASAGGGGKGMRIAWNDLEAREGFQASKNEAQSSFGDDRIFIEKFITQPRHIEIQVLADQHGNCVYLHERECSIQRRNQKVIEEAPSSFLDEATRKKMGEQSVALAQAVNYASAGTVEFIVDGDRNFYFLEMNTRLQVEHPVTELITGIDLVEQMIRVASGEKLSFEQKDIAMNGWAMESRIYAEDPYRNFLPSIGRLSRYQAPLEISEDTRAIRNDTGVYEGGEISMYYDPMIAKLCTWAPDRNAAIIEMQSALDHFELEGIGHNIPFLSAVMDHPRFISGDITTAFIEEEYPDGFEGISLDEKRTELFACIAAMTSYLRETRKRQISGRMRPAGAPYESRVVQINNSKFDVTIQSIKGGFNVALGNKTQHVETTWRPGQTLFAATIGGAKIAANVTAFSGGEIIKYRGSTSKVSVMRSDVAHLLDLMPVKLPPDTSKLLLCPMPGLIKTVNVEIGDEVQDGQALCTVEAMKMENVLRAERRGTVSKINAIAGDNLAVDEIIMEFE